MLDEVSPVSLSLSSVCGPAKLPAAAGHAVVRRLPWLEETTLGCQTGHLFHHRTSVSRLLTGMVGVGRRWECKVGGRQRLSETVFDWTLLPGNTGLTTLDKKTRRQKFLLQLFVVQSRVYTKMDNVAAFLLFWVFSS